MGNRLTTPFSKHTGEHIILNPGENRILCEIENFQLKAGTYSVEIYIGSRGRVLDYYDKGLKINVKDSFENEAPDYSQGHLVLNHKWKKIC